jgi:hypothetical protein
MTRSTKRVINKKAAKAPALARVKARSVRRSEAQAAPVPVPAVSVIQAAPGASAWDSFGGKLVLGLAFAFFLVGQWLIMKQINVIIGILNFITVGILCLWLFEKKPRVVSWVKAVIIGGALVFYNWVAYQSSQIWDMNWTTYAVALVGMVLTFTIHTPWAASAQPDRRLAVTDEHRRWLHMWGWLAATFLLFAGAVVFSKQFMAQYDFTAVMNWFFVLRIHGVIGDIASSAFNDWGRLWVPAMFLGVMVASYAYILKRQDTLKPWKALLYLFVLGNIGSLCIIYLSYDGLGLLGLQVRSIHYHFYAVATQYKTLGDLWHMLGTYATVDIKHLVSFPGTHPPFGIVLNWVLIQFFGNNLTLIALALGALAWTGIFPMYLLGRELYNREMGYYMAGLYATMPNTLIINHVSLDAFTASLAMWAVAFMAMGCRRKKNLFMVLSGLAWTGVALTNYVAPLLLPAMFILAVILLRDEGWVKAGFWAWTWTSFTKMAWFLLGIAVPYVLIQVTTHWKFDYLEMIHYTMFIVNKQGATHRPWFIGSWQGWFGYFIHIGVPVTALFLLRWREILHGDWRNDIFPWIGMVIMLVPFCLATGRQETEREFMIFNVFVVGTAALALWKGNEKFRYMLRAPSEDQVAEWGGGWRPVFLLMITLAYINAAVIEMLVVDHW